MQKIREKSLKTKSEAPPPLCMEMWTFPFKLINKLDSDTYPCISLFVLIVYFCVRIHFYNKCIYQKVKKDQVMITLRNLQRLEFVETL